MIRILIQSCDEDVRSELSTALETQSDIEVVDSFDAATALPTAIRRTQPDVLVIHLPIAGLAGSIMLKPLMDRRRQSPPIVVLTNHTDDQFAARLIQTGVMGCVLSDVAHRELVAAIKTVHSGRRFLCSLLCDALARRYIDILAEHDARDTAEED